MHLSTFLQDLNRLGLTQWEGIEEDIAWGHVTSLVGLARPSIDGPIFIYRAPILLGGPSPRVQLWATTSSSPEPLLSALASSFEDLADPTQFEPWRLIPIDTTRGRSRNRELHHPCYMLVDFRAFRSFGLRPHGVIEVVLGQEEISFPTVLPTAVNAYRPSGTAVAGLDQWGATGAGLECMPGRLFPAGACVVWTYPYAEHGGCGTTSH